MGAFSKIHWTRRHQHACSRRQTDHLGATEDRTARSTVPSTAASVPGPTRTTASASSISITDVRDPIAGPSVGAASATIGTNASGDPSFADLGGPSSVPSRACRRHPNTCCEQTCHRRATSDTGHLAPASQRRSVPSLPPTNAAVVQARSGPQCAGSWPSRHH